MVKGGNYFYQIFYFLSWLVFKFFFRLEIKGEKIPSDGGIIVAANHNSYLDSTVVGLCSRRTVSFLAKEELFEVPVLRWIIRRLTTVPVKRGEPDLKSIKEIISLLKEGRQIGIFPQGTRKITGAQPSLYRGVGMIAQRSGAPVYPISIKGTDKVFVGGVIPIRFPKITAVIGQPILPDRHIGKEGQVSISKRVMQSIERSLG